MSFSTQYLNIKNLVKPELDIIEKKLLQDLPLSDDLLVKIQKFLLLPSKRIRSVLATLYFKAKNENLTEKQLEILSIIELVHNASLIHDDIIDNSEIRRGEKTISKEFGNKRGVIAGDYLLSIALKKLAKLQSIEIINHFALTIEKMCIGEIKQDKNLFKIIDIEQYIQKTKYKTAYLFECALTTCAISQNLPEYDLQEISNFGLNFGIAYQIRDDLLNFQNDSLKPVNNDIESGIFNAPIILGSKDDNYQSGIEKTKILLDNYLEKSKKHLELLPKNSFKIALEELMELIHNV